MNDELSEDLLSPRCQVGRRRLELLVLVARNPELDVFLAELRLQKLAETLPSDYSRQTDRLRHTRQTNTPVHDRHMRIYHTPKNLQITFLNVKKDNVKILERLQTSVKLYHQHTQESIKFV